MFNGPARLKASIVLLAASAALVGAAFLGGCCPGGDKVLMSMTLTDEEMGPDCYLKPLSSATGAAPFTVTGNPMLSTDPHTKSFVSTMVVPPSDPSVPPDPSSVLRVYMAVYECAKKSPEVGVYAVQFREPITPEQRAAIEPYADHIMYKGQLAAIVWSDAEMCGPCYEKVLAKVERVFAQ